MNRLSPILALVVLLGLTSVSTPCTTFVLKDGETLLFGRNFDWMWNDGMVVVNKRGIAKMALPSMKGVPPRWVSKYGSITFNQFGREMPCGGMNEKGLVVETMVLFSTVYAEIDERPVINGIQWVQYQLDNCSTVEEVLTACKTIRVSAIPKVRFNPHYLVCDATGDMSVIEFVDGKMVCHRGDRLPLKALANSTYAQSMQFVENGDGTDASKNASSFVRFSTAAKYAREFSSSSPEEDRALAFKILEEVALTKSAKRPSVTQWSVVYDIPDSRIYYRTRENGSVRWISPSDFDFSPDGPPMYIDINGPGEGHVAEQFTELTPVVHKTYLSEFFGRDDVKKKLGDQTVTVELLRALIQSYRPMRR